MKPTKLSISFALVVAVLLGACGNKENAYWLEYTSHDIKLMDDVQIAVADSFVILVSAFFEDGVCHTYSIADNLEFCHAYGRIGSGVDEFRQPVLTFASGNTFGINDINEMSLRVIGIDSDGTMSAKKRLKATYRRAKPGEEIMPKDTRYTLLPNSNQYVSCLFKGDGSLFTLSNSLLQPSCRFGDSPVGDSLTWYAMRNDLNGYMAASGRTFFYAAENLPYMAAYRLQGDTMQKQWECFYRTPHYKISNDAIRYDKEKATGPLKSLAADEHYVYLLYVDTLMSRYDVNDITKSCSDKVLVFDHSGEYVSTLHLNCHLKKIAVGKNGKLYGIARMPQHVLVEFDLPTQLRGGKGTKRSAERKSELQQQAGPLEIGDTIPYVALYDTLGNTHYLQDFKGKYLLLDFWGAHCGPCKASIPELKTIAETMSDKLEVVSISIDAKSTWKQSSIEHGISWHSLNDLKGREYDAISTLYNVMGYPTFFIVSPEGVILDKMKGYGEGVVTYWLKMNMD